MRKLYGKSDERVFVSIDRKHIQKYCTHYLLYRSEFILLYGILLGTQLACQNEILIHIRQNAGMPTIFYCNVPTTILTGRAFGDLISELDIYSLLRSRVLSRGRYGRTREIVLDLPQEIVERLYSQILQNFEMNG